MSVPDAVGDLLAGRKLMAHLATSHDDRPHVAPVWYDYDPEADILRALTGGRKVANARRNPRVAVSVEDHDADGNAEWMVAMQGTARVVEDRERVVAAGRRIYAIYTDTDADGAEVDADGIEGPLVEVEVANAVVQRY
jgi:nitroimidazol reductase NimA-like FMN-containing flavoprotein (pyridoxamine 5'-phosphate oxidase superfamily)